jgi:hypothetical protein
MVALKKIVRRVYENGDNPIFKNGLENFLELFDKRKLIISFKCYSLKDEIPDPSELDTEKKHIVIFDDIMESNRQTKPASYFCRGRHNNADCFYLSQNYLKIERQTIRTNTNYVILFKQTKRDLQCFYKDYVEIDIPDFQAFQKFCLDAWNKEYGYVIVDLSKTRMTEKYRRGWNSDEVLKC